nr:pyridoxal-phosphate dependent enzyme [Actinomycetota bacterium]
MQSINRAGIEAARERIAPHIRTTPTLSLERGAFSLQGFLILKLELMQHTGSFKARGAFNRILSCDVDGAGVVAASGGNFGVAVAYAAGQLDLAAEVFVPDTSSPVKVERLHALGADVRVV